MITTERKQLLTRTFERLGPDRVEQGLHAPGGSSAGAWHNCFLAMIYGKPGALRNAAVLVFCNKTADYMALPTWTQVVGKLVGLSEQEVANVVELFDHDYWTFRQLAVEWLEFNRRRQPAVEPAQTGYAVR